MSAAVRRTSCIKYVGSELGGQSVGADSGLTRGWLGPAQSSLVRTAICRPFIFNTGPPSCVVLSCTKRCFQYSTDSACELSLQCSGEDPCKYIQWYQDEPKTHRFIVITIYCECFVIYKNYTSVSTVSYYENVCCYTICEILSTV